MNIADVDLAIQSTCDHRLKLRDEANLWASEHGLQRSAPRLAARNFHVPAGSVAIKGMIGLGDPVLVILRAGPVPDVTSGMGANTPSLQDKLGGQHLLHLHAIAVRLPLGLRLLI